MNERDSVFKRNLLRRLYGSEEQKCNDEVEEENILLCKSKTPVNVIPQKVYSVLPPPADFKPTEALQELLQELSEDSDENEVDCNTCSRRRRRRHHGQLNDSSKSVNSEGSETKNNQLTKNQKRKLKKKRHKEKVKKIKTDSESFTYSTELETVCANKS